MAVSAFLGSKFTRGFENSAFARLHHDLTMKCNDQNMYLIGNFSCGGSEIDAMIIKHNSIIIIDFKNYGGEIVFNENGEWWNSDGNTKVAGGSYLNPLVQIRSYKNSVMEWVAHHELLGRDDRPTHIQGLILFQRPISLTGTLPSKLQFWFGIGDFSNAATWLAQRGSSRINLTEPRLGRFISCLGVQPIPPERIGTASLYSTNFGTPVNDVMDASGIVTDEDMKRYLRKKASRALQFAARDYDEVFELDRDLAEPSISLKEPLLRAVITRAKGRHSKTFESVAPTRKPSPSHSPEQNRTDQEIKSVPPFLRRSPAFTYPGR
jgi:hypothetical protein